VAFTVPSVEGVAGSFFSSTSFLRRIALATILFKYKSSCSNNCVKTREKKGKENIKNTTTLTV